MSHSSDRHTHDLERQLAEAKATIDALLSGEIDAVVDSESKTPVMLADAQHALRESEERYRRIVETADEGIAIVDAAGTVSFANRRLAELFGYRIAEIVGAPLLKFVPAGGEAIAARRLARSHEGISEEEEVVYRRRDGSELRTLLRTSPIRDADGQFVGTLGMLTDRTSYRVAEEALRKSEAQYRQIVEATSDGIVQLDDGHLVVFVNGRLAEMLGYDAGEMIGRDFLGFVSPAAQTTFMSALASRKRGGREPVETIYRHRDGTDVSVSVAGAAIFDGEGRFAGTLGLVRDVTERNKLQAQLMVSDRMASIGTLAAGVAHEINNPLAAVIANLDFIIESLSGIVHGTTASPAPARPASWLCGEIRGPIDDAREAARRMRFIVRDLKVFSHAPSDDVRAPVDVRALMDSSLRMAENEIRHRAHVVKQYGPVPPVDANEARIGQVFLNLLVNAAQALPAGHAERNRIIVRIRLAGDQVVIEVSDTGPGIPPEVVGRIFDAFFTTKPVGVGTGLGLAISHRIVTDMGGALTVESTVGKGTTFRVSLPVTPAAVVEAARPEEEATVEKVHGRILLVDDEPMLLRVLERVLALDHDVVSVGSASEAQSLLARGDTFDLILCDLMMPNMTGMELHAELSRTAPEQASRMIFLSGGAFTAAAQEFLADPSRERIEKPFDMLNLRATIQRHLQARA